MANGFIPSQGDVRLYVLGEKNFSCLVRRSFFQDVVEVDIYTGEKCKMHDLMHDLTQSVMGQDCVVIEPGKELITPDEVLYLSSECEDFEFLKQDLKKLRSLRSMLVFNEERCYWFCELPKRLRYMRNLQRLDIGHCPELEHMLVGIKELTHLQRLSKFSVGKDNGRRIGELGNLNLLGWDLRLGLSWDRSEETCDSDVVEGSEPNLGFHELDIRLYMGMVFSPSWLVKLVNLTSIILIDLKKCEELPQLGKLPSLKRIDLELMMSLKCFHDEDDAASKDEIHFPNLQELRISGCPSLVCLPSNFPKLYKKLQQITFSTR
nr:disease resistance protein [Tanacetum cinerariifolium]